MTVREARRWLVFASLLSVALLFIFFLLAPAFGFPLEYPEVVRILQIVLPVFLGYLAGGVRYLISPDVSSNQKIMGSDRRLLSLLVRGPVVVFGVSMVALVFVMGWTNRGGTPFPGAGMRLDTFTALLAVLLGLLAVTGQVGEAIFSNSTRAASKG